MGFVIPQVYKVQLTFHSYCPIKHVHGPMFLLRY